jgi:hypothetical protein
MAETGWRRSFEDPIALPDGHELVTLRDAARYIKPLPPKVCAQEHWQTTIEMLIWCADKGGIRMMAQIAIGASWISCHRPATCAMFHLLEQHFRLHSSKSVRQPRSQPGLEVLSLH